MVQNIKQELRRKLIDRLMSLAKEEVKRRSSNVEEILSRLPIYKEAKVVMGYFPLKGEVSLLRMFRRAQGSKKFCFPVMDLEKKDLSVFAVDDWDSGFVRGPYGVMQPDISRAEKVDIGKIDLVIVPGLAFDRQKNRLGRGAGFYDRFLAKQALTAKTIGVAFDFQLLFSLPVSPPFDKKVDTVVSESEII